MSDQTYYGMEAENDATTLPERLRDYYEPSDFVTVINVDTEPVKYQFSNPAHEQFQSSAPYEGMTIRTAPPTVVTLQPGERKLCPAFEADAMIITLVKQITSNKTSRDISSGKLQPGTGANWTDPQVQKGLIAQIMVSKEDLVNKYNASLNPTDVEKDLDLEPARPRPGRPAKAQ